MESRLVVVIYKKNHFYFCFNEPANHTMFLCLSLHSLGEIINCAALDHEKQIHHQFTVLVTDHGTPRRNATTTVYITVADLNDNKPYFPQLPLGKQLHVKVC